MPVPSEILHLIDLDGGIDPLAALVLDEESAILRGHFEHPALRWRSAAQLFRKPASFAVAWGERAFDVARFGGIRQGIYRPADHRRLRGPAPGWRAAPSTRAETLLLARKGWSEQDCSVVPPPGTDPFPCTKDQVTRTSLRAAEDDFLWLLGGDPGPGDGLCEAVWAGAIMHVMERERRQHRIVLWGGSPWQHRARRFADQLGLPPLPIRAGSCSYSALAEVADAALLLPRGYSIWSAAILAYSGLPAVINRNPAVQEVLGGRQSVRTSPGERTRLVVREMLALVESGAKRTEGDVSFSPERVRANWDHAVASGVSEASGRGT